VTTPDIRDKSGLGTEYLAKVRRDCIQKLTSEIQFFYRVHTETSDKASCNMAI
jgi:hypothetical protein